VSYGDSSCRRPDYDGKQNHSVGNDHSKMTPLVWKKFRRCERGQLALASTEPKQDMCSNGLTQRFRGAAEDGPNEDENVARQDEISAAKQVAA
jgi:hypothetical protein